MPRMITDPEVFFAKGCGRCDRFDTPECSTKPWLEGLNDLRRICLAAGLTETAKWGQPCYMRGARNIAIFGAMRGDFRLSFMNAALLKDAQGVLEPAGPNSKVPSMIRFTDVDGPAAMEPVISAYLAELIGYADAGVTPPKVAADFELPEELVEALDADAELAEAWGALTPGRQRSYVIALSSAKQAATRVARIARFRDKIFAGKGAQER